MIVTEGSSDVVELVNVRSTGPDGLPCQHLSKHTPCGVGQRELQSD